ncbi:MAG TPA: adenylate/guanylate cyclase domain-containing protein, partial [Bacteroidales bacterium]|nr:adenylate/guanylate cyclase domain-containing protein [Bacteroidales bacterium]
MENRENHLVIRLVRLVKENQELSKELKELRERYEALLLRNEAYENLVNRFNVEVETDEKTADKPASQKFNMVTVLFADIHGFKEIKPHMDAEQLIDQLDQILLHFDEISHQYNLHKIKTIGDSFMCAGGIPDKNITNPIEVVLAAFRMLQLVKASNAAHIWEVRFAVHTGPVNAFVNGKARVFYEIKGDTVNIASRIESSGKNGHLMISVMTYELVKEFFDCEYYGKLPVKYKGLLDLYVVTGIKPELSVNHEGKIPDKSFFTKFALIGFHDLQEAILDKLERELPRDLHYHNIKHTVDVVTEVELIGWAEGVSDDDLLILKTAALFHDVGHTRSYTEHEYYGTVIAREILPSYNYSPEQIEKICDMIMSTKMPPSPRNLLEEIMCDADLDYLG